MMKKQVESEKSEFDLFFFYIEEMLLITENGFSKNKKKQMEKCTKTHVIKYAKVLILLIIRKKRLTYNVESVSF